MQNRWISTLTETELLGGEVRFLWSKWSRQNPPGVSESIVVELAISEDYKVNTSVIIRYWLNIETLFKWCCFSLKKKYSCCLNKIVNCLVFLCYFSFYINQIFSGWKALAGPQLALWMTRRIREQPTSWVTIPIGNTQTRSNLLACLILYQWFWQSTILKLWIRWVF